MFLILITQFYKLYKNIQRLKANFNFQPSEFTKSEDTNVGFKLPLNNVQGQFYIAGCSLSTGTCVHNDK